MRQTIITLIADASAPIKLATAVSAGLLNKHFNRPAVYTLLAPNDRKWVGDIQGGSELSNQQWIKLTPADLIAYTVAVGKHSFTLAICHLPAIYLVDQRSYYAMIKLYLSPSGCVALLRIDQTMSHE